MPAQSFEGATEYVTVKVEAAEGAFPAWTTMSLADIDDTATLNGINGAAESEGFVEVQRVHAVDITFRDAEGNEIEPLLPISVVMSIREKDAGEDTMIVHMDDEGNAEVVRDAVDVAGEADEAPNLSAATPCAVHFAGEAADVVKASEADEAVSFRAEGFSVWGVVYTVDFHWDVDGQTYELNLTGGDCVTLSRLACALGMVPEDQAQAFARSVAWAEFSAPELVYVGKIEADTTVGAIKDRLGLACEYSGELTEDQIATIDEQVLHAVDWALISLKAFTSGETLAVGMTSGETFEIRVTDAQIRRTVIAKSGEAYDITVTYGPETGIPEDAALEVDELLAGAESYGEYAAKAEDGNARIPLGGVHFALYDQVTDNEGNTRPAYSPRRGFEDLVTNEDGVIEEIGMDLGTGTYYLREKAAPGGYKKLEDDLCFTIGADGTVAIHNEGYAHWLTRDTSASGTVSYQISVENTPLGITLRKTDGSGNPLAGAQFVLSRKNESGIFEVVNDHELGENGLIDMTTLTEKTFSGMTNGIYKLTETHAPQGYTITTKVVYFNVSDGAVKLTDEDGIEMAYADVSLADENTTIVVKNILGVVLPATGGPGTTMLYLIGILMIALAGAGLVLLKRKNDAA